MTKQAPQPESAYAWLRAMASLALIAISGLSMYVAMVTLKPAGAEFGVSRSLASLPYAATMIGFGLGGIVLGRWADRRGVFQPALLGLVVFPLGLFTAGHAQNIWQLALVQGLLVGFLGAAAYFATLVADATLWFNRRRGRAVAVVISGSYLAGAIWPPVIQHFIDAVGWRQTYIGLAGFCLLAMAPLVLVLRPRPPSVGGGGLGDTDAETPAIPPRILQGLLCAAGIGCCVAMAAPQVHIVAMATDLGYAAQRGAEMLSIMLGCGIVSRLTSGWISDRIGGLNTLLLGSALQMTALALFIPADGLTALYVMSALFGLSQGGIVPSYAMIIRRFFPVRDAGWRIATVLFATMIGMALGGWLAGLIFDATGSYTLAFVNAVAFNIANLAIAGFLRLKAAASPLPRPA
jgi:MFS family permease